MKKLTETYSLFVYYSPGKGRGVFAKRNFKKGEAIETCAIIKIPEEQISFIDKTLLYNYYFSWGKNGRNGAICLGFGSLYNHSYEPNAAYRKDFEQSRIIFTAIKAIKRCEEITVNYSGKSNGKKPLWFKAK